MVQSSDHDPRSRRIQQAVYLYAAVAVMLSLHAALAWQSIQRKSTTFDEIAHLAAGYSYWTLGDYRLDPENGMLPQRWAALPLLMGDIQFPNLDQEQWRQSDSFGIGHQFFYSVGNDPESMLMYGRTMMIVFSTALGLLVFIWSRKLFGLAGGLISLLLCTLSPTVLAHGRLVTSDIALTFMLIAAVMAMWHMLHALTPWTLGGSAILTALLVLSKASGLIIVPIAVLLAVISICGSRPMVMSVKRSAPRQLTKRRSRLVAVVTCAVVHLLVGVVIIWAFHGFRYAALASVPPNEAHTLRSIEQIAKAQPGIIADFATLAQRRHLLPQAYLHGLAYVEAASQHRLSFLNGDFAIQGWWNFFPYALLIKTPLAVFALLILAAVAALHKWRQVIPEQYGQAVRHDLYRAAPLIVLGLVYGAVALVSNLNIGHRHLLPLYPVMFILAGASSYWLRRHLRVAMGLLVLLAAFQVSAIARIHPHYLAYFNEVIGGPRFGYRHLVDSSLDWGQDLPGLAQWIKQHKGQEPVYLSYFGTADPQAAGIDALTLNRYSAYAPKVPSQLKGGIYCISASMLQSVSSAVIGPWVETRETQYQQMLQTVAPFLVGLDESGAAYPPHAPDQPSWQRAAERFTDLRFARLCAYLRKREPDDQIGYSILIYRLSDSDVHAALYGPPVADSGRFYME